MFAACCLSAVRFALVVVRCSLFVMCCFLVIVYGVFVVGCCVLCVLTKCSLCALCRLFFFCCVEFGGAVFAVRCVLSAVCCMSLVVWCSWFDGVRCCVLYDCCCLVVERCAMLVVC